MTTGSWRVVIAVTAVASMLGLSSCGSSGSSQGPASTGTAGAATNPSPSAGVQSMIFAQVGASSTMWPMYIADKNGLFAEHGVKVKYVTAQSPAAVTQALIAGSADMGSTGIPDIVRPIMAGANLAIAVTGVVEPPYSVLTAPSVKSWQDLVGKKIIVGSPQDISRYYFDTLAAKHGLKPSQYSLTYAGATSQRYAALKSGSVAGTLLLPPFDVQAKSEGYTDLGTVAAEMPGLPFTGLAINKAWAAGHPKVVEGFIAAYLDATNWLYDPANEGQAEAILEAATNTQHPASVAAYQTYVHTLNAFSKTGKPDAAKMDTLLKGLTDAGILTGDVKTAASYIDSTYVDAVANGS